MANTTYLLNLSSGNLAPIMKQQGDCYVGIDTDINTLLNLTSESVVAPRYRFFLLNSDDTIQEELPLEDILSGGSYSENYQNGQRCSISLNLYNQNGKYTPTINKFWVDTKLRFDAGIEQQDGAIIWVQKGVFIVNSVQPSYGPDSRTISISAGDKFSDLERGAGVLASTFEIASGVKIYSVVKELLGLQRGNGTPIDSQLPWFHPKLINQLTQNKLTKNAGETIGSIILDLANQMSAEVFYNSLGRLCFFPMDAVADDNDKPILYNYIAEKGELTNLDFSLDYSNIINKIILIGATVNGGVVKAEAANQDPFSPLCTHRIGERVSVINQSNIKTRITAEENAKYQLRKQLVLKTSVSLNPPYNPLFGVNNLLMITDHFYGLTKQFFLLQSVSFNFDYTNNMSLSVSNLNNLPFINSYRQVASETGLESGDRELLIPVAAIVNLSPSTATYTSSPFFYLGLGGEIYFTPPSHYGYPNTIDLTGAEYSYNSNMGLVTITNVYSNIVVTASCPKIYSISVNGTHCSAASDSPTTITAGSTVTITLVPDPNYDLPDTVSVSGADSFSYNSATGAVTVSKASVNPNDDDIVITAVAITARYSVTFNNTTHYTATLDTGVSGYTSPPLTHTEKAQYRITADIANGYFLGPRSDDVATWTGAGNIPDDTTNGWVYAGVSATQTSGTLTVNCPTDNVVITFKNNIGYTVTGNITNGTLSYFGPGEDSDIRYVPKNCSAPYGFKITPNTNYDPPQTSNSISVTNANYPPATFEVKETYAQAALNLATGNVTITATCPGKAFNISYSITNGGYNSSTSASVVRYGSSATVYLTANSGYTLPTTASDITVTNATRGSWNASTGALVISNPTGAVTITATCEAASSGGTVTISGDVTSGTPYHIYDGQDTTSGTLLATISTSYWLDDFSTTVSCSSGWLYIDRGSDQNYSEGTTSGGVTYVSNTGGTLYQVTSNGSITGFYSYPCMIEGTKITLADGSTKNIENITYDDELLVWNFYEGKLDTAKPMWIMEERTAHVYNLVKFDNGEEIGFVGPGADIGYHRVYNVDKQSFTHTGSIDTPNGTTCFCEDGALTHIVSQEVIHEDVKYYNIITDKHFNVFANTILTSCTLSNKYAINSDMTYDLSKQLLSNDAEKAYIDRLYKKGE